MNFFSGIKSSGAKPISEPHHPELQACHVSTNTNNEPLHKMGREDQKEEREVLDSIFPDEIQGKLLPNYLRTALTKNPTILETMRNF